VQIEEEEEEEEEEEGWLFKKKSITTHSNKNVNYSFTSLLRVLILHFNGTHKIPVSTPITTVISTL
jgi:hypothetical protein